MLTDLEIAQKAMIQPITDIAKQLNISPKYLIPYGKSIAKIDFGFMHLVKHFLNVFHFSVV